MIEDQPIANPEVTYVTGMSQVYRPSDMLIRDQGDTVELWVTGQRSAPVVHFDIVREGRLQHQAHIVDIASASQMEHVILGGAEYLVTGALDASGLKIHDFSTESLTLRDTLLDHDKSAFEAVADLARISNASGEFVIAGSALDEGISSVQVTAAGELVLIDTLSIADGLWLSGLDSVTAVTAQGADFVVVGAVNSSSLTLVRVNAMGVLFIEDHVVDTRDTRYAQVDAVTSFSINDRGFVVAGGSDNGLSLLEILPDFSFFHHGALANETDAGLVSISALAVADFSNEIQVIASGQPGLTMARLDKSQIGGTMMGSAASDILTGSSADDLIWGDAGADTIDGGDGDDLIFGGAGLDRLSGGDGADVFLFSNDLERDEVLDFQMGLDRLDISAWGRIYDASSLAVSERSDGAVISYNQLSLRLFSEDGSRIEQDMVTNDMFLF
ncbi:MAG: hypothetical protein VYA97_02675 [Pseudomonadota bacterium]|nr:hypothetical protein [Pseudomonadota bacterium]